MMVIHIPYPVSMSSLQTTFSKSGLPLLTQSLTLFGPELDIIKLSFLHRFHNWLTSKFVNVKLNQHSVIGVLPRKIPRDLNIDPVFLYRENCASETWGCSQQKPCLQTATLEDLQPRKCASNFRLCNQSKWFDTSRDDVFCDYLRHDMLYNTNLYPIYSNQLHHE